jgi:hypothetical protein
MEAHRWASGCLLSHNQEKMLRIVLELRTSKLQRLGQPGADVQLRVLVRGAPVLATPGSPWHMCTRDLECRHPSTFLPITHPPQPQSLG